MNPFIADAWYLAAWASELTDEPLARTILGQKMVFYRSSDGRPAALLDRCPHRFAPLHRGRLTGAGIECAYHGLTFDGSGTCVHNPYAGATPSTLAVRAFPVAERHGAVWVWPGEPARAQGTPLPDLTILEDPKYRTIRGRLRVDADYRLVTDNLMDLSHIEFIHAKTFGGRKIMFDAEQDVRDEGEAIVTTWWMRDIVSPKPERMFAAEGRRVDHWLTMRWNPPATMILEVGLTFAGRPPDEGKATIGCHVLTPETATTTHYFWSDGRTYCMDAPEIEQQIGAQLERAFELEDRPIIEAVQNNMETSFWEEAPASLGIDRAAIRVRRRLEQLIERDSLVNAGA